MELPFGTVQWSTLDGHEMTSATDDFVAAQTSGDPGTPMPSRSTKRVHIIVVDTSLCRSNACTERMSVPDSGKSWRMTVGDVLERAHVLSAAPAIVGLLATQRSR